MCKLYYKLRLPLLDYVNKKYGVNENLPVMASARGLNLMEVKEVANKLWGGCVGHRQVSCRADRRYAGRTQDDHKRLETESSGAFKETYMENKRNGLVHKTL